MQFYMTDFQLFYLFKTSSSVNNASTSAKKGEKTTRFRIILSPFPIFVRKGTIIFWKSKKNACLNLCQYTMAD